MKMKYVTCNWKILGFFLKNHLDIEEIDWALYVAAYDELKKVPIDIFLRLEWFSTFIVKTFFKASSHVNKFLIISSQLQAGCQEDKTLHESKRILPGTQWFFDELYYQSTFASMSKKNSSNERSTLFFKILLGRDLMNLFLIVSEFQTI